jgi:hypothetical protein
MRTVYVSPIGVIQLSYNISRDLIEELKRFSKKEQYNVRTVRIKLAHQSDKNFCKYTERHPFDLVIANFMNKGSHVYLQVLEIQRVVNLVDGAHYKIAVAPIKQLPK